MSTVKIASVSFLLEDAPHTIGMNIERACGYIAQAAAERCDIVCLPEMFRTVNLEQDAFSLPEPVPGPTSVQIAGAAKAGKINVIAPYYITDSGKLYNQATVFDRQGAIVGTYRKVQPTVGEVRAGVFAGDQLPVFDLDIGRIAVMICMDVYFPEIHRIYALKGARALFWPTVMHGPTQEGLAAQLSAIAINNCYHVIESNLAERPPYAPYAGRYRPGTARIISPAGDVLASTGRRDGLAIASVDLHEPRLTSNVVLHREPDHYREDMESITRMDLYAREYALLASAHTLLPDYAAGISHNQVNTP